jgi:hypothetical protein
MRDLFRCNLFQRSKDIDTGIVHQDIHLTEGLLGFGEELIDLLGFRHTATHRDRLSASLGDAGDHLVGPLFARSVVHHHRRALRRKFLCYARANALRCARNHRHLTSQLSHLSTSI